MGLYNGDDFAERGASDLQVDLTTHVEFFDLVDDVVQFAGRNDLVKLLADFALAPVVAFAAQIHVDIWLGWSQFHFHSRVETPEVFFGEEFPGDWVGKKVRKG